MSERGVMTADVNGKRVEVIPFVGVKPRETASILSRYFNQKVTYRKREEVGGAA